jgi:hypothetical protein
MPIDAGADALTTTKPPTEVDGSRRTPMIGVRYPRVMTRA